MSGDVLQEVAEILYGGGADELIAKMNPTQSDISAARKKRERTEARVGLATNIVGIGAGAAATPSAIKAVGTKYREKKGKGPKKPGPVATAIGETKTVQRAGKFVKKPNVALGLAGGAAGLQVANLAGDFVANRVLSRSAKKNPDVMGGPQTALRETKRKVHEVTKSEIPNTASEQKGSLTKVPKLKSSRKGVYAKKNGGRLLPVREGHAKVEKSESAEDFDFSRYLDSEVDVIWEGDFAKADSDKQQIFGWASVVEVDGQPVVDLQGDLISIDEMEKAGYEYVMKSRKGGDMHLRDDWQPVQKSEMIESFIVTPEKRDAMGLPDNVPSGWWVGFQVRDPEVWAKVKSGERTGFSIHGHGRRKPA